MIEACKDYMYFVAVVNLWGWVAVGQGSLCCQAGPIHTPEKGAPIRSRYVGITRHTAFNRNTFQAR